MSPADLLTSTGCIPEAPLKWRDGAEVVKSTNDDRLKVLTFITGHELATYARQQMEELVEARIEVLRATLWNQIERIRGDL